MHAMMRTGPLLLALGVALAGCYQAGNGPSQDSSATTAAPSESDYVLTVEGMH